MALAHAMPATPIDVRPFGNQLREQTTQALFKSRHLEVMRLVLKAGDGLAPHRVSGEITVHCVEGELEISADDRRVQLGAGQMLYLAAHCVHGVAALSDASALVTIALRG